MNIYVFRFFKCKWHFINVNDILQMWMIFMKCQNIYLYISSEFLILRDWNILNQVTNKICSSWKEQSNYAKIHISLHFPEIRWRAILKSWMKTSISYCRFRFSRKKITLISHGYFQFQLVLLTPLLIFRK